MEIDVNKPIENPKLSGLLAEYTGSSKEDRLACLNKVAEELAMNAVLLAVIQMDFSDTEKQPDGSSVFKKDSEMAFEMFAARDNVNYLPVYTDWNALRAGDCYKSGDIKTLVVRFDDIAAITAGRAGVVINPFTDNVILPPKNVMQIKQHKDAILKTSK